MVVDRCCCCGARHAAIVAAVAVAAAAAAVAIVVVVVSVVVVAVAAAIPIVVAAVAANNCCYCSHLRVELLEILRQRRIRVFLGKETGARVRVGRHFHCLFHWFDSSIVRSVSVTLR